MTTITALFSPTIARQLNTLEQRLDSINRALSTGHSTQETPGTNTDQTNITTTQTRRTEL